MGIQVKVGTYSFEVTNLSVNEDSTPLSGADSTGGVGSVTFTLPQPDPYIDYPSTSGYGVLKRFGSNVLLGKPVGIRHGLFGITSGTVSNAGRNDQGLIQVTCIGKLGDLNAYNVQAQPFSGTLGDLLRYYFSLAGVTTSAVDSSLDLRPVAAPGWNGELWFYLKQLCAAESCEIALVENVVTVRPNRTRYLVKGTETAYNQDTPIPTLAQSVEVYQYNNYAISNEPVYPPGGWSPEVEVLNVNAGEQSEYYLELSASVSSIIQPTMVTNVNEDSVSVYSIVANDGLPVAPALWTSRGGKVEISIDPDTVRLYVKLTGASGIPTSTGEAATNFSLAMASDTTSNRYSSLRISGSGVAFDKQKHVIRTGVTPQQSGTPVGVTVDNPFISTTDQRYRAGLRAANQYSGFVPTLSTTVLRPVGLSDQTYGNVNGMRVWDKESARYYRVRTAAIDASTVDVSADDDLTVGDIDQFFNGLTSGEIDAIYAGFTSGEIWAMGMRTP